MTKKSVVFNSQSVLDNKIDKLTDMMEELTIQSNNQCRPSKPKIYQGKRRGQGRTNYYDRGR